MVDKGANEAIEANEEDEVEEIKISDPKSNEKQAKIIVAVIAAIGIFTVAFLILSYTGNEVYEKTGEQGTGAVALEKGDMVYVNYTGKLENGTVFDNGRLKFTAGAEQKISDLNYDFGEVMTGMKEGEEKTITIPPEKAYGNYDQERVLTLEKVMHEPRFINISVEQYKQNTGKDPVEGESLNILDVPWPVKIASIANGTVLIDVAPSTEKIPEIVGERIVALNKNEIILSLKLDLDPSVGRIIRTKQGNARISEVNETTITLDFNHPLAGKTLIFELKIDDIIKENEALPEPAPVTAPEVKPAAEVTIIEYSDFQCPFCSKAVPTLYEIKEVYGDRVEIIFKQFPLASHKDAQKAAEASECARDQGKFWGYHDILFANQGALSIDNLKQYALDAGLNTEKFDACLDSSEKEVKVKSDMQEGLSKGVDGTPTFFIEDYKLIGAQPFDTFKKIIDEKLSSNET